jgi:hypothetical protein
MIGDTLGMVQFYKVQILNSSFGLTMNARNDWTNPASFASSASGTATWNGFRGPLRLGYCGLSTNSETEEIALSPLTRMERS